MLTSRPAKPGGVLTSSTLLLFKNSFPKFAARKQRPSNGKNHSFGGCTKYLVLATVVSLCNAADC
jgi:hypothetical protein